MEPEKKVKVPNGDVVNCVQLEGGKIILAMTHCLIVFNTSLTETTRVKLPHKLICYSPSQFTQDSYWLSFELKGDKDIQAEHVYYGRNAQVSSYIEHWTYDQEANKLASTTGIDTIVLRNESVIGLLEYDPERMIFATHDNRLLLFHDGSFVRTYDGPGAMNTSLRKGCYLECLPGFDHTIGDLLFIVWSLEDAIYLVNLNNTSVFPFISREISTFDTLGQ